MADSRNKFHKKHSKPKKAHSDPFPDSLIEPMLCTLMREPFTDDEWIYEVKFDGYRIMAYKNGENMSLRSRKLDYTKKYSTIVDALRSLPHDFIVDGEIVAVGPDGIPDFDALQRFHEDDHQLVYYVFDMIWLDGQDMRNMPLSERKAILKSILPAVGILHYSHDFADGTALYQLAKEKGLEGIVAKQKDSIYIPAKRSRSWLKVPVKLVQDFVIGGWTESENGMAFRSLLFGNYVNGKFIYVGHVGHGFKEAQRDEILKRLRKIEVPSSPFNTKVETATQTHWVKPECVASIEFSTWTDSGNIRKPATFKGWRPDKIAREVIPEKPLPGGESSI